jgi:hypothetical protein
LHGGAHGTDGFLVGAHLLEHHAREHDHHEDQRRQCHERCQCQLSRDSQGDSQRAGETEHHVHRIQQAKAEQHAYLREVVGRSAHDVADRHTPVERGSESLQLMQQRAPQLVLCRAARVENGHA